MLEIMEEEINEKINITNTSNLLYKWEEDGDHSDICKICKEAGSNGCLNMILTKYFH